jgi:hypothetical protein
MARSVVPALVVLSVVLALGAPALAGGGSERVFGPPGDCPEDLLPCGEPLTLASGEHLGRPVEIVAYSSAVGLCVDVVHGGGSSGVCGPNPAPRDGHRYAPTFYGVTNGHRPYSEIVATVAPAVARVRVRYKRAGEWRRAATLVGQITHENLEQLKVPESFGVLVATLRGCDKRQRYRARAFDASGVALGSGQLRRAQLGCGPKGSSSIIILGPPSR